MELIDLSRELFHRTQTHPSHPPVIMTVWGDHSEKKHAGNTVFSSKALSISLSDHAGTHVDAPVHFDPRPGARSIDEVPLEDFYTSAICLDLSHVALKHAVTVSEMEAALAKSGQEIKQRDTVLLYMATNERLLGKRQMRLSATSSGMNTPVDVTSKMTSEAICTRCRALVMTSRLRMTKSWPAGR